MRKGILLLISVSILIFICIGCQHGDFKAAMVIQGQPVPFDGVNIGPELYIKAGQPAKISGGHIWFNGLEDIIMPQEKENTR